MACRIAAGDHSPSIVKTSQSFHDASRIAFGTNGCSRDRDRIINSPARSPVLEAVLNGAHRSYVNFAPPAYPSAGAIGASLVVNAWRTYEEATLSLFEYSSIADFDHRPG